MLLLVVSESGWVYTFTTDKFKPLVKEDEHGQLSDGQRLIAACLVRSFVIGLVNAQLTCHCSNKKVPHTVATRADLRNSTEETLKPRSSPVAAQLQPTDAFRHEDEYPQPSGPIRTSRPCLKFRPEWRSTWISLH